MATKFLALLISLSVIGVMMVAGNAGMIRLASPTGTPAPVRTTEATAEATVEATVESTEMATAEATESALVGDPVRGEDIFRHGLDGAPPCITCHNPTAAGRNGFSIGPGLKGIGERGATRIEGLTAPEYIENSIRHPGDYVVTGFNSIMPTVFGEDYSDQAIADLVAFLMTL